MEVGVETGGHVVKEGGDGMDGVDEGQEGQMEEGIEGGDGGEGVAMDVGGEEWMHGDRVVGEFGCGLLVDGILGVEGMCGGRKGDFGGDVEEIGDV
jgi:hypothetical protein